MLQGFQAAELRVERDVFRQVAEHLPHMRVAGRATEHPHLTTTCLQQAEDQFHAGGLARAVMAEQAQHFPGRQAQAQVVQHSGVPITLGHAFDFDNGHHAGSLSRESVGSCISGWLSITPGDLITGNARCTQRSNSMPGLFINRRTWGYSHSRRSTLSLGS